MDGEPFINIPPWYKGFKGIIKKLDEKSYESNGIIKIINKNVIHITEIPIGIWTQNYRDHLEYLSIEDIKKPKKNEIILNYKDNSGNNNVDIMIELTRGALQKLIKNNLLYKTFKLKKKINLSNMHLYNSKGCIQKYYSVSEILEEYYVHRLDTYRIRKEYYVKLLTNQMLILKYKVQFIEYYIKKKIVVERKKKAEVLAKLETLGFPKLSKKVDANDNVKTYNYITDMQLFSLTEEKIKELNDEYNKKLDELENYTNTTLEKLWKTELNEFSEMYKKWIKENKDDVKSTKNKSKVKRVKKKSVVKVKKQ